MKQKNICIIIALVLLIATPWSITGCLGKSEDKVSNTKDSLITADKLISKVNNGKPLIISGKVIKGNLDFTKIGKVNKKLSVSSVYIENEISFKDCVFEDSVLMYTEGFNGTAVVATFERNVSFIGCQFKKPLIAKQTNFRGRFDFDLSKTDDHADFSGVKFGNGTSFRSANFGGDVSFVSSTFDGRANFFKVLFKDAAIFQYVRFNDIAMFSDAQFYGGVDMSKLYAAAQLDFANAKFHEGLTINNSLFLSDLRFVSSKFSKRISLTNSRLFGQLNFYKAQFLGSVIFNDNTLLSEPDIREYTKSDSCEIEQTKNKIIDFNTRNIL